MAALQHVEAAAPGLALPRNENDRLQPVVVDQEKTNDQILDQPANRIKSIASLAVAAKLVLAGAECHARPGGGFIVAVGGFIRDFADIHALTAFASHVAAARALPAAVSSGKAAKTHQPLKAAGR